MKMDEILFSVAEKVKQWVSIYLVAYLRLATTSSHMILLR